MHSSTRQPVQKGADGVAADLALLSSTAQTQPQQPQDDQQSPLLEPTSDSTPAQAPIMHFPHCRLGITPIPSTTPNHDGGASTAPTMGKMEQVALPGALVRTLLARFEESQSQSQIQQQQSQHHPHPHHQQQQQQASHPPPAPRSVLPREGRTKRAQRIQIQRYFDDDHDWVYTRCLLADFTGFREDEAEALVVLRPLAGDGEAAADSAEVEAGQWELGFVVQRVGVRDPGAGGECF
ncbi:hypothetical protein NEMBOFW57_002786 [Staphylotrichum longicolle]|uniref:Uncharacterized protein n=1 Tax=Staphylotrichum longicolle TaxID=669026 RepID=A0AAD4F455_9PEZI|nr:hypothetical protein NEMBOFW57_002786 [Staphylotrichum longicolle]